ncbi:hypothetical protein E1A91_D06G065300v1 [Gossypium mustelinum]|uniref:Uncharacterized protein n=1 Tax=Gossypium mustelinum TaxID=34275 RepID=A0A5D2UF24_GOSMU|nr:hypothetical protein E1A91_D06G065300v1 [Gossypium mustelinum]
MPRARLRRRSRVRGRYILVDSLSGLWENSSFIKKGREVQRDRAAELLGLRACNFRPRHSSKLGNEFRVFTNYDPGERLGGWEQEQ